MTMRDKIQERYADTPLLFADGFDDAIIGVTVQYTKQPSVAYNYHRCVEILIERDGMDYEEAVEYMDYNVTSAWVGEHTPSFVDNMEDI